MCINHLDTWKFVSGKRRNTSCRIMPPVTQRPAVPSSNMKSPLRCNHQRLLLKHGIQFLPILSLIICSPTHPCSNLLPIETKVARSCTNATLLNLNATEYSYLEHKNNHQKDCKHRVEARIPYKISWDFKKRPWVIRIYAHGVVVY